MKKLLALFLVVGLFLSSCNNKPARNSDEATTTSPDSAFVQPIGEADSLIIKEPLVRSLRHYFSDTSVMDSFVVELPAGNIMVNRFQIKIYNSGKELIYADSMAGFELLKGTSYKDGVMMPDAALDDVHESIVHWFNVDNFSQAGEVEYIKNAAASQITNMVGWNEAIADSTKMVYNYTEPDEGIYYVTYSQKLKKGVKIVKVNIEDDRD